MSHYNEIREEKKEDSNIQLTFGQLVKIKREKMGLNIKEAMRRTKVTGLINIENGKTAQPRKQAVTALIAFYKLTNEEMKALKTIDPQQAAALRKIKHPSIKELGLEDAISIIDSIYKKVADIKDDSFLAKTIKGNALENLSNASGFLKDIAIIERII